MMAVAKVTSAVWSGLVCRDDFVSLEGERERKKRTNLFIFSPLKLLSLANGHHHYYHNIPHCTQTNKPAGKTTAVRLLLRP